MKLALLTITTFCFVILSQGQDTIRVEPSNFYSSETEPYRGKDFTSRVRYAREDILFNNRHKRIEYCYYYDKERICYGDTYRLIGDSTLQVGDSVHLDELQSWTYRKVDQEHYFIYRFHDGVYESGFVNKLIPLERTGKFMTMKADKTDTLWIEDYTVFNPNNPYDKPEYIFPKAKIRGKIFEPQALDNSPTLLNGENIPKIQLERTDGCLGEPLYVMKTVSFVVTKTGKIRNIEQYEGNFDLDYCPYYFMELMTKIIQLEPLKPARREGESVNAKWYVEIDMMDPLLNELKKHPSLTH